MKTGQAGAPWSTTMSPETISSPEASEKAAVAIKFPKTSCDHSISAGGEVLTRVLRRVRWWLLLGVSIRPMPEQDDAPAVPIERRMLDRQQHVGTSVGR